MTKMTESDIELMAIEQLEGLGYAYVYGPDIEFKGSNPLRSYKQVILEAKVVEALKRKSPICTPRICSVTTKHFIGY